MGKRLTKNFTADDFRCRCKAKGLDVDDTWCHGEVWVHRELVERLQELWDRLGRPVKVLSGCRCPRYNAYVGGSRMSQHKRGTAADIVVEGIASKEVAKIAKELGLFVIEFQDFMHVDVRRMI